MDAAGREVYNGRFNNCTTCTMDLSTVESGNYLWLVAGRSVRIAVVRWQRRRSLLCVGCAYAPRNGPVVAVGLHVVTGQAQRRT